MQLEADSMSFYIWIHPVDDDEPDELADEDWLVVECNFCTEGTAVFFKGDRHDLPSHDWLTVVGKHIMDVHEERYKREVRSRR